jgi:hypothetical protein
MEREFFGWGKAHTSFRSSVQARVSARFIFGDDFGGTIFPRCNSFVFNILVFKPNGMNILRGIAWID